MACGMEIDMTDNTQPEALRLATASNAMADEGEMIHLLSWHEIRNLLRANAADAWLEGKK